MICSLYIFLENYSEFLTILYIAVKNDRILDNRKIVFNMQYYEKKDLLLKSYFLPYVKFGIQKFFYYNKISDLL